MSGKRILVTGATGFIGSHLVAGLVHQGATVYVLQRASSNLTRLQLHGVLGDVQTVQADMIDPVSIQEALRAVRPNLVYHLATYGVRAHEQDLSTATSVNILGAANLVDACHQAEVGRLVWLGSGFEYALRPDPIDESVPMEPVSLYGATKVAAGQLADYYRRMKGLDIVTVRLFSAFGPMEHPSRFIPLVITRGLSGEPVSLTAGTQERDYLYVDDVVTGLIRAGESQAAHKATFNLGSGEPASIRQIAETIADLLPAPVELSFGEMVRNRPEPSRMVADPTRLRGLGWKPVFSLRDGLLRTIEWYASNRSVWGILP